jgi:uncharacterized protein (DUF1697 family)
VTAYVALLRAVNVGGTGKLPMADLRALAQEAGFARVRTYIASGNLVFDSDLGEAAVKARLEAALKAYAGKPVGVIVRTAAEMAAVLAANPFPAAPKNRTVAIFLDTAPPGDFLSAVSGGASEEIAAGRREIFVHYPDGQGNSKLKIPAAGSGTARNLNTIATLAEMAAG